MQKLCLSGQLTSLCHGTSPSSFWEFVPDFSSPSQPIRICHFPTWLTGRVQLHGRAGTLAVTSAPFPWSLLYESPSPAYALSSPNSSFLNRQTKTQRREGYTEVTQLVSVRAGPVVWVS
jgi:hypothetical protein